MRGVCFALEAFDVLDPAALPTTGQHISAGAAAGTCLVGWGGGGGGCNGGGGVPP